MRTPYLSTAIHLYSQSESMFKKTALKYNSIPTFPTACSVRTLQTTTVDHCSFQANFEFFA